MSWLESELGTAVAPAKTTKSKYGVLSSLPLNVPSLSAISGGKTSIAASAVPTYASKKFVTADSKENASFDSIWDSVSTASSKSASSSSSSDSQSQSAAGGSVAKAPIARKRAATKAAGQGMPLEERQEATAAPSTPTAIRSASRPADDASSTSSSSYFSEPNDASGGASGSCTKKRRAPVKAILAAACTKSVAAQGSVSASAASRAGLLVKTLDDSAVSQKLPSSSTLLSAPSSSNSSSCATISTESIFAPSSSTAAIATTAIKKYGGIKEGKPIIASSSSSTSSSSSSSTSSCSGISTSKNIATSSEIGANAAVSIIVLRGLHGVGQSVREDKNASPSSSKSSAESVNVLPLEINSKASSSILPSSTSSSSAAATTTSSLSLLHDTSSQLSTLNSRWRRMSVSLSGGGGGGSAKMPPSAILLPGLSIQASLVEDGNRRGEAVLLANTASLSSSSSSSSISSSSSSSSSKNATIFISTVRRKPITSITTIDEVDCELHPLQGDEVDCELPPLLGDDDNEDARNAGGGEKNLGEYREESVGASVNHAAESGGSVVKKQKKMEMLPLVSLLTPRVSPSLNAGAASNSKAGGSVAAAVKRIEAGIKEVPKQQQLPSVTPKPSSTLSAAAAFALPCNASVIHASSMETTGLDGRGGESSATAAFSNSSSNTSRSSSASSLSFDAFNVLLPLLMDFVPYTDLMRSVRCVSRQWLRQAQAAASWRVSSHMSTSLLDDDESARTSPLPSNKGHEDEDVNVHAVWKPFFRAFPWGSFLAAGGYKQVYRVWCKATGRLEAMSVMDIEALSRVEGGLGIVGAEIKCGCLATELIHANICHNFVETYQVFAYAWSPSEDFPALWGTPDDKYPQGRLCPYHPPSQAPLFSASGDGVGIHGGRCIISSRKDAGSISPLPLLSSSEDVGIPHSLLSSSPPTERGTLQYIRMELCRFGDVEDFLRRIEPTVQKVEAAFNTAAVAAAAAAISSTIASSSSAVTKAATKKKRGAAAAAAAAVLSTSSGTGALAAVFPVHAAAETATKATAELESLDAQAASLATSYAFQMIASIHCCHDKMGMRHNDIKLLNFLLKPAADYHLESHSPSLSSASGRFPHPSCSPSLPPTTSSSGGGILLNYSISNFEYGFRVPLQTPSNAAAETSALLSPACIVKLCDWGTADVCSDNVGKPILARHFTTIENMPPEYFFMGDQAVQSYQSDSWALGLCLVHLLTGSAPYEELMSSISCPLPLRSAWSSVWTASPSFSVLRDVAADDPEHYLTLMADTLYRFAVLTASPGGSLRLPPAAKETLVSRILFQLFQPVDIEESIRANKKGGGAMDEASKGLLNLTACNKVRKVFSEHCGMLSLSAGKHPCFVRARRRLTHAPALERLCTAALEWDWTVRSLPLEMISSPAFEHLRVRRSAEKEESFITLIV